MHKSSEVFLSHYESYKFVPSAPSAPSASFDTAVPSSTLRRYPPELLPDSLVRSWVCRRCRCSAVLRWTLCFGADLADLWQTCGRLVADLLSSQAGGFLQDVRSHGDSKWEYVGPSSVLQFLKLKNQRKMEETQLSLPSRKAEAVDDVKVGAEELWVKILEISLTLWFYIDLSVQLHQFLGWLNISEKFGDV